MSEELAENVKRFRMAAGLSQEDLAERAGMSVGPIRCLEQGKNVRMETLREVASALGVTTSQLMMSSSPEPVGFDPNRMHLRDLRAALTPAVSLRGHTWSTPDNDLTMSRLRRSVQDFAKLYFAGSYGSLAIDLPRTLRAADDAVAGFDGDDALKARVLRSQARRVAGMFLTQVRQYDLAHIALSSAVQDAQEAGDQAAAASAIGGMCWLLMRTTRFDEAERIAAESMDVVEPRIKGATEDEYATWGGLAMEAAAAAARNHRVDEAKEYRKAAATAGKAVGRAHRNLLRHWSIFGPVTVAMKELEDSMIVGDARTVLRRVSDEEVFKPKAWERLGGASTNDTHRYRLDVARARVRTGDASGAMEVLAKLDAEAPEWFRHQHSAVDTFHEVTKKRRTLTTEMRAVGSHLGVFV
ncbi:helix-turn-helix domain-containing protein [Streptomyces sp. NPDC056697]|uniref:helix-turn-helix domain-containing protein n=1 Tax=Streptomyces sp. NPDC056697 TaxID=3345915 RepID=UPI0036C106D6